MPELVKVGFTTRTPRDRARELGATTGIPVPFLVAYERMVIDCEYVERLVHSTLEAQGYRVADNREFFRAPLSAVIDAILKLPPDLLLHPDTDLSTDNETEAETIEANQEGGLPWMSLWIQAKDVEYGLGSEIQDDEHAKKLYLEASRLGCSWAYYRLAQLAFDKSLDSGQFGEPKRIARIGIERGNYVCYLILVSVFAINGDKSNAQKSFTHLLQRRQQAQDDMLETELNFFYNFVQALFIAPEVLEQMDVQSLQCIRNMGDKLITACDRGIDTARGIEFPDDEIAHYLSVKQKLVCLLGCGSD